MRPLPCTLGGRRAGARLRLRRKLRVRLQRCLRSSDSPSYKTRAAQPTSANDCNGVMAATDDVTTTVRRGRSALQRRAGRSSNHHACGLRQRSTRALGHRRPRSPGRARSSSTVDAPGRHPLGRRARLRTAAHPAEHHRQQERADAVEGHMLAKSSAAASAPGAQAARPVVLQMAPPPGPPLGFWRVAQSVTPMDVEPPHCWPHRRTSCALAGGSSYEDLSDALEGDPPPPSDLPPQEELLIQAAARAARHYTANSSCNTATGGSRCHPHTPAAKVRPRPYFWTGAIPFGPKLAAGPPPFFRLAIGSSGGPIGPRRTFRNAAGPDGRPAIRRAPSLRRCRWPSL